MHNISSLSLLALADQLERLQLSRPPHVLLYSSLQLVDVCHIFDETIAWIHLWTPSIPHTLVDLLAVAQFCPLSVDLVYCL